MKLQEEERREKMLVEKYTDENLKNVDLANKSDDLIDTEIVQKLKYENVKYGDSLMKTLETAWKFHEEIS